MDHLSKGEDVANVLRRLKWQERVPKVLLSDNGPEFISRAISRWAQENEVKLFFIEPGKPTQNAFTESFNGKIYNEQRPHSSLGRVPPKELARRLEEKKLNEISRDQRLQVVVRLGEGPCRH